MGCKKISSNGEQNHKLQRSAPSAPVERNKTKIQPLRYPAKVSKFDREIRLPYCTDFGPDRDIIWKDFLFCSNCKKYEEDSRASNKNIKRCSKYYYECVANHGLFDHPTTLKDGTQREKSESSLLFHFHAKREKHRFLGLTI